MLKKLARRIGRLFDRKEELDLSGPKIVREAFQSRIFTEEFDLNPDANPPSISEMVEFNRQRDLKAAEAFEKEMAALEAHFAAINASKRPEAPAFRTLQHRQAKLQAVADLLNAAGAALHPDHEWSASFGSEKSRSLRLVPKGLEEPDSAKDYYENALPMKIGNKVLDALEKSGIIGAKGSPFRGSFGTGLFGENPRFAVILETEKDALDSRDIYPLSLAIAGYEKLLKNGVAIGNSRAYALAGRDGR